MDVFVFSWLGWIHTDSEPSASVAMRLHGFTDFALEGTGRLVMRYLRQCFAYSSGMAKR